MRGRGLAIVIALCMAGGLHSPGVGAADAHDITLPAETAVLKVSPLAGYQIAVQKCQICHSADYINLQPPGMSLAQWTAEVLKMKAAYGAPIDEADVKLLGIYLASTYGDATVPGAERRSTPE